MTSSTEQNQTSASDGQEELEKVPGDRYEILSRLGVGAFGSVLKALDTFLNRMVAIKSIRLDTSLNPDHKKALNKRFIREAQVAAQLHHPNIVTIHDIIFTPETGFIVMEFIEGSTLQEVMESQKLGLARIVDIVTQVAKALAYAHDHKVTHRDIKPANIMITPEFEARITDFGIARADGSTHLTHSGSLVGTPDYMSPEQAKGEEVDSRSDLFSLGCVLYECACGEKPFRGGSLTGVLLSIVNSNPFEAKAWKETKVPAEVTAVLERALAKDPDERFLSAGAFVSALDAIPQEVLGTEEPMAPVPASETSKVTATPVPEQAEPEPPPRKASADELQSLKEDDRPLRFVATLSDDLQDLKLTPTQGYVLSRVDGVSLARDIITVSAVPEAEAAGTLVDLFEKGLLVFVEDEAASEPVRELDEMFALEVDRVVRLGKEKRYSELLGIDISTPGAEVKKSYLERVQRYHPDAQEGRISASDHKKLTRVCAILTEALSTVSGKHEPPPAPVFIKRKEDPAATGSTERREFADKLFGRAKEAFGVTDFWEAIQLSRQAIELDSDVAEYHHLLGLGLMKNQNWIKEAEESLLRAAELDKAAPVYFESLATLYERRGAHERAAEMTKRARELSPAEEETPDAEEEAPKEGATTPASKPALDLGEEYALPVDELEHISDTSKTVVD